MYMECLTDTRGLPLRWYILQGECIVIAVSIFKMTSKRGEGREEGREEGSGR